MTDRGDQRDRQDRQHGQGRGVVAAPLRIEAHALGRGGAVPVVRTGMGERKSRNAAVRLRSVPALVIAGMGAGMRGLKPGEVVVATEVRDPSGHVRVCPWADEVAAALREAAASASLGPVVHTGPVATVRKLVRPAEREALAARGVVAADMESSFLLGGSAEDRPWAVVRVVSDAPGHELLRPGIVRNGLKAYTSLKVVAPVLSAWLRGPHPAAAPDVPAEPAASSAPAGRNEADLTQTPKAPRAQAPQAPQVPGTVSEQDGGDDVRSRRDA